MNEACLAQIDAEYEQEVVSFEVSFVGHVTAVGGANYVEIQINYSWARMVGSPTIEVLKKILCLVAAELRRVLEVHRCTHGHQVGHLIQLDRIEAVLFPIARI